MSEYAELLVLAKDHVAAKWEDIQRGLEAMGDPARQFSALKALIEAQSAGERPPEHILMTAFQHLATCQDHKVKKLLFIYYEIIPTVNEDGKPRPEFLLICDALRNDLLHPNEYIRAAALRLVSKFNEKDLMSKLVSTIAQSLTHRSPYVRRHAVVALGRINQRWPDLAPDAPNDIADLLKTEQDPSCRRVAFLLLCDISKDLAAEFLDDLIDQSLLNLPQPMQLTATALIKNLCCNKRKASYLSALTELIQSPWPAVQLSSALTLLDLTSTPTASRAGLTALTQRMMKIPNSSLQRSIADQIERVIPTHTAVCQSLAVEFLQALNVKPIRKRILEITEKLITASNAVEVAASLVKQLQETSTLRQKENEKEDACEFMKQLMQTLRVVLASQPCAAKVIYDGLAPIICDQDPAIANDAMNIIRDIMSTSPEMRETAAEHLENIIGTIQPPKVFRMAAYLISMYSTNENAVDLIIDALSIPEQEGESANPSSVVTVVLEDGTYVQKTSYTPTKEKVATFAELLVHEPFLISATAMSLARLCLRLPGSNTKRALAFVKGLVKTAGIEREARRVSIALNAMQHPENEKLKKVIIESSENAFENYIVHEQKGMAVKSIAQTSDYVQAIDSKLNFGSLLGRKFDPPSRIVVPFQSKRGKVIGTTGVSDPLYLECRIIENKYDVLLEFSFLNQTRSLLTDIKLSLTCIGSLEVVDKAPPLSIYPGKYKHLTFAVKVTSAEAGRIYGSVTYDMEGFSANEAKIVPMDVIVISPANYMEPCSIDPFEFRQKWDGFEWEKKLPVSCPTDSLETVVTKICKEAKLKPVQEIDYSLPFVTANLYSKSYFGEEVLVNVNVEYVNGHAIGFLRMRTATQSLTVSYSHLIRTIASK